MWELALLAGCLVCAGWLAYEFRRRKRTEETLERVSGQLEHLQRSFQRFVPQDVVESIIQKGVLTSGERREVTILFADLAGFTALSENTVPETVVTVLNAYFQSVTRVISEHNGFVSKFMGDGLMAIFGAPDPNPWHQLDAARAALAIRSAVRQFNAELQAKNLPSVQVCMGLHAGTVVAGVIGSSELVEYTVIGDVVNTAARIESLTRRFDTDILVSAAVRQALDSRFVLEAMEPAEVKGKSEPVLTWALREAAL